MDQTQSSRISAASRPPSTEGQGHLAVAALSTSPGAPSEYVRRRSRLVEWLLGSLIALALLGLFEMHVLGTATGALRRSYDILILSALALLTLAFLWNRSGHYTGAARLTVGIAMLGAWGSILADPSVPASNPWPLNFTLVSVLLSGILLPVQSTVLLAAAQLSLLVVIANYVIPTPPANWPSMIAFHLFVSVLSVVSSVINRRDREQLELQSHELAHFAQELQHEVDRDGLTGLHNRRYLDKTFSELLAGAKHHGKRVALVILDIDNFKAFNDDHGHAAGDAVLRDLAQVLTRGSRASDLVCRYGGDEFVLVWPDMTAEEAVGRANQLRLAGSEARTSHNGSALPACQLSFGIAVYPEDADSADALLGAADRALYRDKGEGRGGGQGSALDAPSA